MKLSYLQFETEIGIYTQKSYKYACLDFADVTIYLGDISINISVLKKCEMFDLPSRVEVTFPDILEHVFDFIIIIWSFKIIRSNAKM